MVAHSENPESASRAAAPERAVHERMARLLAENELLRRDNATLQSVKDGLQESEKRYRRLFEDDLTGDFLTTADGRILACNSAFVRMFGFASIEGALGTNVLELYSSSAAPSPSVSRRAVIREFVPGAAPCGSAIP